MVDESEYNKSYNKMGYIPPPTDSLNRELDGKIENLSVEIPEDENIPKKTRDDGNYVLNEGKKKGFIKIYIILQKEQEKQYVKINTRNFLKILQINYHLILYMEKQNQKIYILLFLMSKHYYSMTI